MLDIDISSCQTLEQIQDILNENLKGQQLVDNRRQARRYFRTKGVRGRVHESVAFRKYKEIPAVGSLRRNQLVCAIVTEFKAVDEPSLKAFSIDTIRY